MAMDFPLVFKSKFLNQNGHFSVAAEIPPATQWPQLHFPMLYLIFCFSVLVSNRRTERGDQSSSHVDRGSNNA